jgi:hypothetical protein
LQAVEPNSLILSVSLDPHLGQAITSFVNSARLELLPFVGGAIP